MFQEVAYVAYHFHWSREEILSLPHRERHRWIEEISAINGRINESSGGGFGLTEAAMPAVPTQSARPQAPTLDPTAGASPIEMNALDLDEILSMR